MGIFAPRAGTGPADDFMPTPMAAAPVAPQKPGAWAVGGMGRNIVGYIADALAQMGGVHPVFAEALKGQREEEQLTKRSLLAQQLAEQQWRQREEYKRANPAPYRFEANNGDQMEVGPDGQPRTLFKDPTARLVRNYDGTWSTMPNAAGAPIAAPVGKLTPITPGGAGSGQRTFQPSAVMDSLIQQESGGRPGVLGPQTRYGQAQGLTQMLPATAQGIAKKLGVPWRPDLMTGTSPDAAAYQRALGQAYLEEGFQATGNIRDALHYYHGGPSRKLWGSKTRGYADSVISRLGGK